MTKKPYVISIFDTDVTYGFLCTKVNVFILGKIIAFYKIFVDNSLLILENVIKGFKFIIFRVLGKS